MRFFLILISILYFPALMGQTVVINEVLAGPDPNPADFSWQSTANANSLYSTDPDMLPPYNREFIELYNTHPCDTIDISCYTLGSNASEMLVGDNWGAFTFPQGTKIPPLGFIIVGGNDAQVPFLDFNLTQYRQSSFNIQYLCGDLTRWFLRDAWGWIALYDPSGAPVDAVYWNQPGGNAQSLFTADEYKNSIVNITACNGTKIHLPAYQIPGIEYIGNIISGTYLSFQRVQDGSVVWHPTPVSPTPRAPNGLPVQPATLQFNITSEHCGNHDGEIQTTILDGGTGPYTIYWNGDTIPGSGTLSNLAAGTFTIRVVDKYDCLITYDTIVVIDDDGPEIQFTAITHETCSGHNGAITTQITGGTLPYSCSWSTTPATTTASLTGLSEGVYHLSVSDLYGCVAEDSVIISNHKEPVLTVQLLSPDSCGLGRGIALADATGDYPPYLFSWNSSPVQTTPMAQNLSSGTYTVTVTDGVCPVSAQINIPLIPGPVANFSALPQEVYVEDGWIQFSDQSTGNVVSWLWDFMDGYNSTDQNPHHQFLNIGTYKVTLSIVDDIGCPDSITKPILVKDITSAFFPNAFTPDGDGLNDVFKPVGIYITEYHLSIFDRLGRLFFQSDDPETGWDGSVEGQPAPDGVYVYMASFSFDYGENVIRKLKMKGSVTLIRNE